MKYVVFFAVFLAYVNLSLQLPKLENCPADYLPPRSLADSCGIFTCDGPNEISGVGCGTYACSGAVLKTIEPDNTKPYPECCGGPICAD